MKSTRKLVVTAIFSALAFVLMLLDFPIPFLIPSFIQFDFSELPALICSFAVGPVWGGAVCLVKNLLHLFVTTTGGVGELANFLLGACFVVPAGIIYKNVKSRKGALLGSLAGSLAGALASLPINFYITYPFYMNFMPEETILSAYQAIIPSVKTIFQSLLVFNLPFTFFKFICDSVVTFFVYKHISVLLKGKKR
ncbi:MAG: ECF transporter S component [Eubacteriales bacterium]